MLSEIAVQNTSRTSQKAVTISERNCAGGFEVKRKKCPHCKRLMPFSKIELKQFRSDLAKKTSEFCKKNGIKQGRKRKFDYDEIRKYKLETGLSFRAVADHFGCFPSTVQKAMIAREVLKDD